MTTYTGYEIKTVKNGEISDSYSSAPNMTIVNVSLEFALRRPEIEALVVTEFEYTRHETSEFPFHKITRKPINTITYNAK